MIITEETSIKELFYDNMISLETYNILISKRLVTVGKLLGFIGDTHNIEELLTIQGMTHRNYLQIQNILSSVVHKRNQYQEVFDANFIAKNKPLSVQDMTVDEMCKIKFITKEELSIFKEAGLVTFEAILFFQSASNTFKEYLKTRLGAERYEEMLSAMKGILNFTKAERKEKEDNCHITTSPKSSYTSALDCHTQLGSEGNVDLALYYQNNVITESEFSLLKKESIYTINDVHAFLNNMIGHLTYLKHKVGERDFNALLMVLYKIKDYKFSKHQPQRKSENITESKEASINSKMVANNIYVYLTTSVDELFEQNLISRCTLEVLKQKELSTIEAILYKTKNLTYFNDFNSLHIETIKEELCNIVKYRNWLKVELCNRKIDNVTTKTENSKAKTTEKKTAKASNKNKISTPIYIYHSTSIIELYDHNLISDETFEALKCAKTYTIGAILRATDNLRNFQAFRNIVFFSQESKDELIELFIKKSNLQIDLYNNDTIDAPKLESKKAAEENLTKGQAQEKQQEEIKEEKKQAMKDSLPVLPVNHITKAESTTSEQTSKNKTEEFELQDEPLDAEINVATDNIEEENSISDITEEANPMQYIEIKEGKETCIQEDMQSLEYEQLVALENAAKTEESGSNEESEKNEFEGIESETLEDKDQIVEKGGTITDYEEELTSENDDENLAKETASITYTYDAGKHPVFDNILKTRGLSRPLNPIWKMNITPEEQEELARSLYRAYLKRDLYAVGEEAALYYAIWWQKIYDGGSPSSEAIAESINIPKSFSDDLYKSARLAYKRWGFHFIHDNRYHYFRSLLMQGGLPIGYVVNNKTNFSGYKEFLRHLVEEYSSLNIDLNTANIATMSCVSYLPKSFKNDSIYEISTQIAHAIVEDREDLLPYDSNKDGELHELTSSLKRTASEAKTGHSRKPLSFNWEVQFKNDMVELYYCLNHSINISSRTIAGLNCEETFSFDLFVNQQYVATYKRSKLEESESGIQNGIYHCMNFEKRKFSWKGESYIELKLISNEGECLFINALNCYPPEFSTPQQFQKTNNIYIQQRGRKAESNVILVTKEWEAVHAENLKIFELYDHTEVVCYEFSESLELVNSVTSDRMTFTNTFTKYSVEFGGIFIGWLESSNYKLLNRCPYISVWNESGQPVESKQYCVYYRLRTEKIWHKISRSHILPFGWIEIKIDLPDNHTLIESFYSIGNLTFESSNETITSATISCHNSRGKVVMEKNENFSVHSISENRWHIERNESGKICPTVGFRILIAGMPSLKIEIPAPFIGLSILDSQNHHVKQGEIISVNDLTSYRIITHGNRENKYRISYIDSKGIESEVCITGKFPEGIIPLSNFEESIRRIYDLYVDEYDDINSHILFSLEGISIKIKRYIYGTSYDELEYKKQIRVFNIDASYSEEEEYKGKVMALPIGINIPDSSIEIIDSGYCTDGNISSSWSNHDSNTYVIFSDKYEEKQMIPKVIHLEEDVPEDIEDENTDATTVRWKRFLESERLDNGPHWKSATRYFEIAAEYHLPFKVFECISTIAEDPSLLTRFILVMFLAGKNHIFTAEVSRLEHEYAIGIHWIKQEDWQRAIDSIFEMYSTIDINIAMTLMPLFMTYLEEMLKTTLDSEYTEDVKKFISGELSETEDLFSKREILDLRSRILGKNDNNADLPYITIKLEANYFVPNACQGITGYQFTFLKSPIIAAEYAYGEGKDIWTDKSEENIRLRRIINFYRTYFTTMYSYIFTKALKILNKKYNGLR